MKIYWAFIFVQDSSSTTTTQLQTQCPQSVLSFSPAWATLRTERGFAFFYVFVAFAHTFRLSTATFLQLCKWLSCFLLSLLLCSVSLHS